MNDGRSAHQFLLFWLLPLAVLVSCVSSPSTDDDDDDDDTEELSGYLAVGWLLDEDGDGFGDEGLGLVLHTARRLVRFAGDCDDSAGEFGTGGLSR